MCRFVYKKYGQQSVLVTTTKDRTKQFRNHFIVAVVEAITQPKMAAFRTCLQKKMLLDQTC